jgi:phage-related protein
MAEAPTMEVRARLTAETAQFTRGMEQARRSTEQFTNTSTKLRSAMNGVAVGAGVLSVALITFATKSFNAAARVDELDYAMNAVGKATGLGYEAIRQAALETKGMGIEMEVASQSAIKFAQNNLDLAYASELARAAQDLAVISGKNSTDVFNMLTHAVITGRSEVLKSVGIQKSAGKMYEDFAITIGKTARELTYQEKQLAVATGALAEAAKVAGTYEAAMDSPGKVLRSFARLHNEIQVSVGGVLLTAFGPMIKSAYELEKSISQAFEKSAAFKVVLEGLTLVFQKLTAPITAALNKAKEFTDSFTNAAKSVDEARERYAKILPTAESLATSFERLLPPIAAVTAGFATMGGTVLFKGVPVFGALFQALRPLPVALIVLALTSTQVRTALVNLFSAFKPLLPAISALAKFASQASVLGVAILAKAINILAGVVRAIITTIQNNIGVLKVLAGIAAVVGAAYGAWRLQILLVSLAMTVQGAVITAWGVITKAATALTLAFASAMRALGLAMTFNPIGIMVAAIVGLVVALGILYARFESVREVVNKVFNFMIRMTIRLASALLTGVANIIKGFAFLMKVFGFLVKVVAMVFEFIIDTILTVFIGILSGIKFLIDGFISLMETNSVLAQIIEGVFNFIIKSVLVAVRFILNVFKNWIDFYVKLMDSQGMLYNIVKFVFNGIIKIIGFIIQGILKTFANLIGGVADLLGVFNKLFAGAKSIFFGILDAISGVGKGIFGVFRRIGEGVGGFLQSVFDAATAWIRKLLELFSKIPKIGPIVANALNAGLDATRGAIAGIATLGVNLGEGLFNSVVNGVKTTVNAIQTVGTSSEKGLRTVEKTLRNFAVKVNEYTDKDNVGPMLDKLIAGAKKTSEVVGTMISKIKDAEQINFGKKVTDTLIKGAQMASDSIGGMIEKMEKMKDFKIADKVSGFIDNIVGKVEQSAEFLLGLTATMNEFADNTDFAAEVGEGLGNFIDKIKNSLKEGLGFGDILEEEKKKAKELSQATGQDDNTAVAAITAQSDLMKKIREAMLNGIQSMKDVLQDLQDAAKDFADSLKDTILGFAGLKGVELPDGFIPKAKSLIENMRMRLDKTQQFTQQIASLQAMGLDAGALKSIIEEGPIKGAQLAASILGGGMEAVQQVSDLQRQISFAGAAVGQFGSDVAFGDLIKSATTRVGELESAEFAMRSRGNNVVIEQGAFVVNVDTTGAADDEERANIITRRIQETFAILAKELAAK